MRALAIAVVLVIGVFWCFENWGTVQQYIPGMATRKRQRMEAAILEQ